MYSTVPTTIDRSMFFLHHCMPAVARPATTAITVVADSWVSSS